MIETVNELKELIDSGFRGVKEVHLTNAIVNELLDRNKKNRSVRDEQVMAYARTFDEYGYVGVGMMSITSEGNLADGQHRLYALKRLYSQGISIPAYQSIMFGVTDEETLSIDNGAVRSYSDSLCMQGITKSPTEAAALRIYCAIMYGTGKKPTAIELSKLYAEDFKPLVDLVVFPPLPVSQKRGKAVPAWVIAGFRILQKIYADDELIKSMVAQMYNEDGCLSDPFVRFRMWLTTTGKDTTFKFTGSSKNKEYIMGFLFNAARKFVNNEKCLTARSGKLGRKLCGRSF